jgi:UDP-N-acetylglucosamine 2-epimerase (non-hydrolysing)
MKRVTLIVGTRPDVIKMSPVARALRRAAGIDVRVVGTGQHRDMMRQAAEAVGMAIDRDLDLMQSGQTLEALTGRVIQGVGEELASRSVDMVLVQGDTTTAFGAALAAYYRGVPVGHVEAGLRTADKRRPFPEEVNRRLIGAIADLHFAPTERCRANLVAEHVPESAIHVTGNTVVDALLYAAADPRAAPYTAEHPMILATAHRRESWDEGIEQICLALRDVAAAVPDVRITFPVHPNPRVKDTVERVLGASERIALIEPPDYLGMVGLLRGCRLVLTDSGGLQEEAPTFGKPVLVMRDTTERPEGIDAGVAMLVGTRRDGIVAAATQLLTEPGAYEKMAKAQNPYGDGHAAERIADTVSGSVGVAVQ